MRYIIRLIAVVPMLSAAISTIACVAIAFDYPLVILLAIGNFFALQVACHYYEETVDGVVAFLRMLCDKTDGVA